MSDEFDRAFADIYAPYEIPNPPTVFKNKSTMQDPNTLDWINGGLTGLQTLGSLWGAFQAAKLAKKQFKFTKAFTTKNLANQVASYNTALEDRARSRAAVEDQSSGQMQSYIDKNRLSGL